MTSPHAPSTATAGRHLSQAHANAHPWTPIACHPPHSMYLSPNVLPTHADAPPMPSAHPLHATTTTLYVPLPPPSLCHCRCPLHTTAAALSVPPPPPSPYHPCRPLRNTPVAVSLPLLPPSHISMPPSDARLVVPDMRCPTCTTPPRRCPTHRCMVPPRPVAFTTLRRPPTAHLLVPRAPHSCPWPAPTCFASHQRIPMCPLAPTAPTAHPHRLHHVPVAPMPTAPPTCHCPPPTRQSPHRCIMPLRALTDVPRAPPGVRHCIYVSHGVVPIPEWLRCLQLVVMGTVLENRHVGIPMVNPTCREWHG